jgi:hypothetical protein
MQKTALTTMVLHYQETGRGEEELLKNISLKVYYYPRNKYGWAYDECSDFYCYFYPRIHTLINNFTEQGKPFEAYLNVTLRFQLKTFIYKKAKKRRYNKIVAQETFMELSERNTAYMVERQVKDTAVLQLRPEVIPVLEASPDGKVTRLTHKRRLLFLALLGSMDITLRLLEAVSQTTGYDLDWLFGCIQELKERMINRRQRMKHLILRRNRSVMRVYKMHEELAVALTADVKATLIHELMKEKHRIQQTTEEMGKMPITPTHNDIAEVLHIPKGTVDSGLFHIKHALEHMCADQCN